MRVLLISCLLIGSVVCGPVDKDYGDSSVGTSFVRQPISSANMISGIGVSSGNTGSPAPQDAPSSAGSGSYLDTNMAVGNVYGGHASIGAPGGSYASGYDSSASAGYGFDSSAAGGSYAGGYDSSASAGYGFDSSAAGGSYAGGYDSSASAGYGFDSSVSGGSYSGGYDSSATAGYGFDSSASDGSYAGGYDSSASAGYGFDSGYDSSASAGYGFDGSVSGGSYAGGYDSSASAYVGDAGSSGFAYGYDAGDDLGPVFSDVSDLDPVYAFSSRSSYQRGGAIFDQTRYTPGEPVPQQMPARRVISKTSKQSSPKAPSKGAF